MCFYFRRHSLKNHTLVARAEITLMTPAGFLCSDKTKLLQGNWGNHAIDLQPDGRQAGFVWQPGESQCIQHTVVKLLINKKKEERKKTHWDLSVLFYQDCDTKGWGMNNSYSISQEMPSGCTRPGESWKITAFFHCEISWVCYTVHNETTCRVYSGLAVAQQKLPSRVEGISKIVNSLIGKEIRSERKLKTDCVIRLWRQD